MQFPTGIFHNFGHHDRARMLMSSHLRRGQAGLKNAHRQAVT